MLAARILVDIPIPIIEILSDLGISAIAIPIKNKSAAVI
jgi:hypothetical protein